VITFGAIVRPVRFFAVREVETLHELGLSNFGGAAGVREPALLDAAIAMARTAFGDQFAHAVSFGMAAGYTLHLSRNRPYIDGNKRTAFAAGVAFLHLNGWEVTADHASAAQIVLDVVAGRCSKDALGDWYQASSRARPSIELRDFVQQLDFVQVESAFTSFAVGSAAERVASVREAGESIPMIRQASLAAMAAAQAGDHQASIVLDTQALLLTVLYRIAEDAGYEW